MNTISKNYYKQKSAKIREKNKLINLHKKKNTIVIEIIMRGASGFHI